MHVASNGSSEIRRAHAAEISITGYHRAVIDGSLEPVVMKRYAAKLLFQFKVVLGGSPGKRRLCEERIVLLPAHSAQAALAMAKARGKRAEHRYTNSDGNLVYFEFVGVMDLLELGVECAADEVWYDITQRLLPSERRSKLIPPKSLLTAIRNESPSRRKSKDQVEHRGKR